MLNVENEEILEAGSEFEASTMRGSIVSRKNLITSRNQLEFEQTAQGQSMVSKDDRELAGSIQRTFSTEQDLEKSSPRGEISQGINRSVSLSQ